MHRRENWLERIQRDALKEEILKEANFQCSNCGTNINLTIHHKKKVFEFPELEFDRDNIMVLCNKCHVKLHRKEKR